jgi:Ca-activated chloride channel family protein
MMEDVVMQQPVTLINDDEWTRAARRDDDGAGFGAIETARGNLPLAAMDVRAAITGLSYRIQLRQTFVNNLGVPIEASYIFPLPDRGAVTAFRLRVAGREVEGEIQERGAARRNYNQAIQAGHRAAIAEEERSGVFTMRVGNLVAGDRAVIELEVIGSLELEEGCGTFRFPLVVAPRYIPGKPLAGGSVGDGVASDTDAVPDASRITPPVLLPGYPNPVRLGLSVAVDPAGLPIANLRCALHAAVTSRSESGAITVELEPGERLDRDFILRFDLGGESLATSVVASPDADGDGGTFCLTALPPRGAVDASRPRDVIFVLDRSGSMDGWKMIAARRAVARMVDGLDAADRFAVLAFDNTIETPATLGAGLVDGTDRNRFRAVEFLSRLEARGGTEMLAPLVRAADLLAGARQPRGDRERVLVLATDGQVGNEDQILRQLAPRLEARVFTLGIDRAVNEGFLRKLAVLGAGSFSLVESEDRLDEVMEQLHRRIGEPLITELAIAGDGLDINPASLVPRRLPDLFANSPITVWGRYRGRAAGKLVITGADGGGGRYRRELTPVVAGNDAAAPTWARGRIRDLEDEYAIGRGDKSQLASRISELSLRHKVLCRFTAFVAVDRDEVVNAGGDPHKIVQPVELPDGWQAEAGGGSAVTRSGVMPLGAMDFEDAAAEMAPEPQMIAAPPAPPMRPGMPSPAASISAPPPPGSRGQKRKASATGRLRAAVNAVASKLREEAESEKREGGAPDWNALAARSIADRLTEILERHRRRGWMPAGERLARLVRELEELETDLRSLATPAPMIDQVRQAASDLRAIAAPDPVAAAESVIEALLEAVGQSRGPVANDESPRRDEPFWR